MSLETVKKCLVMESDSIDYEKLRMELENQLLAGSGEWPYLTTNLAEKGIVTVADMFRLTNAEIWQLADSSMKGWTITAVRTARSMFAASYGMTEEMMIGIVKDQIK